MNEAADGFPNVQAWLTEPNRGADAEAADRIAALLMDGIASIGDGITKLNVRLIVLSKLMAISLAALPENDEGDAMLRNYVDTIGGAVEHEVHRVRKRVWRDLRLMEKEARRAG